MNYRATLTYSMDKGSNAPSLNHKTGRRRYRHVLEITLIIYPIAPIPALQANESYFYNRTLA